MKTKKTITKWLEFAAKKQLRWAFKAIEYANDSDRKNHRSKAFRDTEKFKYLSEALADAFDWFSTPEGFDYWDDIFQKQAESEGRW